MINICADLNIKMYKYCSSENPTEPIIIIDGFQYYLNKFEAYSANYVAAKNILKLIYNKLSIDNKLNNKYIHQHWENYVLIMVIMILKD